MSFEGFSEHEIMEMLLFYVFPRGNTNPLAHQLTEKFGTVKGVLNASPEELTQLNDVNVNCALALKFFNILTSYVARQELGGIDARDFEKMLEYAKTFFYGEKTEKIKVFCINNKCQVQSVSDAGVGTSDRVTLDFKELTKIILNSGCNNIILAHNHPNAQSDPSQEDIILTRKVQNYLAMLDINVLDHYVIGDDGITSMRSGGLIT